MTISWPLLFLTKNDEKPNTPSLPAPMHLTHCSPDIPPTVHLILCSRFSGDPSNGLLNGSNAFKQYFSRTSLIWFKVPFQTYFFFSLYHTLLNHQAEVMTMTCKSPLCLSLVSHYYQTVFPPSHLCIHNSQCSLWSIILCQFLQKTYLIPVTTGHLYSSKFPEHFICTSIMGPTTC